VCFKNPHSRVEIYYEADYIAPGSSSYDLTLNIYPPYSSPAQQLTKLGRIKNITTSYQNRNPPLDSLYPALSHVLVSFFSSPAMRPRYLYLYVSGSPSITMYCKNLNPNVVRSSMHACMLLFLPVVVFLVHAFLPKINFISSLSYFQQAPNTDIWLIPSHLTFVCFVDLPSDCLELLPQLFFFSFFFKTMR
jgi:hypothetical protein